jgi:iron complex transport system substrate-binding protein
MARHARPQGTLTSPPHRPGRRGGLFRLAGLLTSLLFVLATVAACGSDDAGTDAKAAGDSPAGKSAFPVTLQHKYGSTTVESEPKRVVTVGLTEQDALLALGVVPVGTTEWLGGYPGAVGPWAKDELGKADKPTVLKDTGSGPQFEKIAALKPDLILALYSGLTKEQYGTLSKFAPTVAQPKEYTDYGIPWQELTKQVGKAVGKPDEAEKLVKGVEDRFALERKEHPEFKGAEALMATPYEGLFVYGSQDSRSRVLTDLGFTLPSGLDKAIGDGFGANISKERTDLLDTDALVWIVADVKKNRDTLHKDALYGDLKVAKEEREVYIAETSDYGNATSFISVLSLPYLLDGLVPQLSAAVDGDTKTVVEQPAS